MLDKEDLTIGRIRDVVILPGAGKEPPRALGLVVTLQRRRIFVNLGQIAEISVDGAHLHGGAVDLERFTRRTGEILASELYGQHVEDGRSRHSPSHTAVACYTAARKSCPGTGTRSCSRPTR